MKTKLLRLTSAVIIAMFVATVSSSWRVCPPNTGDGIILVPNPDNCREYYECFGAIAILMRCPEGLYFCPQNGVCAWNWDPSCIFDCIMRDDQDPPGGGGNGQVRYYVLGISGFFTVDGVPTHQVYERACKPGGANHCTAFCQKRAVAPDGSPISNWGPC